MTKLLPFHTGNPACIIPYKAASKFFIPLGCRLPPKASNGERTGAITLVNRHIKWKRKQRRGYTLTEALLSLVCISFVIVAVLTSTAYIRRSSQAVRGEALVETYLVSVAETITQDLQDGIDITNVDYNQDVRLNDWRRTGIYATIDIDWEENVFGSALYEIRVDYSAHNYNVEGTSRFFLRGGTF